MNRVAFFLCLYLVRSCNSQNDLFEGASCTVDETVGVCVNIRICKSALKALRQERHPKICSFSGIEPIVCCLDENLTTEPTTKQQSIPTTTLPATTAPPVPTTTLDPDGTKSKFLGAGVSVEEDTKVSVQRAECPPISPNQTAAKTGQKAWDKCIEYQEQLVMPCDASQGKRYNYCRNDLNVWILNGEDAYEGEFPHMALVGYGSDPQDLSFLCGGSLISNSFILTAGHCTSARNLGQISYVLLGVLKRSSFDQSNLHKVSAVLKHPKYKPPGKYNDIALLQLETPVKLSDVIVPACLDVGDVSDEQVATATGWGTTAYRGESSDILQKVDLTKFTARECMEKYPVTRNMVNGFDSKSQICYGDRKMSRDTCQGDSGGPLQVRNKKIYCMYTVLGITSFGRACGVPGEPALYTKVAHYLPWIESLVWPDSGGV